MGFLEKICHNFRLRLLGAAQVLGRAAVPCKCVVGLAWPPQEASHLLLGCALVLLLKLLLAIWRKFL